MSPGQTFRHHVASFVRKGESPDPAVTAEKILADLSDAECRVGLETTLTDYVRHVQNHMATSTRHGSVSPMSTSGKVTRARSWWADVLATALEVGGEWKYLRDCTADDLDTAAETRYRIAAETKAQGDQWSALAKYLRAHRKMATVADVPEAELAKLLGATP
jgi:hypothetical protein